MGDFLNSIAKWPVFLAGSFLNNFLTTLGWVRPVTRNPLGAITLVMVLMGGLVGLVFTLRAMLGKG